MTDDATTEAIRRFVLRHTDGLPVEDDEDLFDAGYVNSLFAVQLVMWIEQTFALAIRQEELMLDNLRSVDAVAVFVAARTAPASDAA